MPSEPIWLSAYEITELNKRAVAQTNEPFHLRDVALLHGAVARPKNHWAYGERVMGRLAAWLLLGVAQNHPFEQGNKRTGLLAAYTFLRVNGWTIRAADPNLAQRILDVLDHAAPEDELVTYFGRIGRRR